MAKVLQTALLVSLMTCREASGELQLYNQRERVLKLPMSFMRDPIFSVFSRGTLLPDSMRSDTRPTMREQNGVAANNSDRIGC